MTRDEIIEVLHALTSAVHSGNLVNVSVKASIYSYDADAGESYRIIDADWADDKYVPKEVRDLRWELVKP